VVKRIRHPRNFFDPRLDDPAKFPVAARAGFGHVTNADDQITAKLGPLHFYQLAIPAPAPPAGSFDRAAAARGKALFNAKAECSSCHVPPLMTEPGWNMHTAAEVCIDDFQASRSPDDRYRTTPLNGLWTHAKGGFYHDGRFPTLLDVVDHYDSCKGLGLSAGEKSDLVEYLNHCRSTARMPMAITTATMMAIATDKAIFGLRSDLAAAPLFLIFFP
jgi:CxxC motif-containing protein (DUF1111 family)